MGKVLSLKKTIKAADKAEETEDFSVAIKDYEEAIQKNPLAEKSYDRLMILYRKEKDYKKELKLKALATLAIIIVSLIPVYLLYKYMQKVLRPGESAGRLFLYLFAGFALVFVYTFLLVFIIKEIFPEA